MIEHILVTVMMLPVVAVIWGVFLELIHPIPHEEDSLREFTEDEIREMFGEFDAAKV